MHVETIRTEGLGDRSYVVDDGEQAVVVDPQRDLDRVEAVLAARGVRLAMVCETHVHNDYVTGGFALARRHDAMYVLGADDPAAFARTAVRDGDELTVGGLTIRALLTPGHTPTHLSYVVTDGAGGDAVFSGGSLLYGAVGRTDLVDPARADEFARAQHRSARRIAAGVPGDAGLYPTHGFGSFCAASAPSELPSGTVADEHRANAVFRESDEATFAAHLVAGFGPFPAYYAHMAPLNLTGPAAADLATLPDLGPRELAARIAAGEWVVDLRDREAFSREHLAGSVGIAASPQCATWVGWLIPWGTPVTLVGTEPAQIAAAQRALARIGVEPAGRAHGAVADLAGGRPTRGYPTVDFDALSGALPVDATVLDVRHDDEWTADHVAGAVHVPLPSLLARLDELPAGPLWVHCQSAYRASVAASLLDRAGREVVLVADSFDRAVGLGLTTAA
jgi:hydroxyacylglutathione hydrolase